MRRTLAIAWLAARTAVRSRLVIALIGLLAVVVLGLPAVIKGDGTTTGKIKITLQYSLGFSMLILGAATLWAACGSISQEIEGRQIRLVVVKPVQPWHVWVGKWLGLAGIAALLLAVAGCAVYIYLKWHLQPDRTPPEELKIIVTEIMCARQKVWSRSEDVGRAAEQRLRELLQHGTLPQGMTRRKALAALKRQILTERSAVRPGGIKTWHFDPPDKKWPVPADAAGGAVHLRARFFSAFALEKKPISGTWQFLDDEGELRGTLPMDAAPEKLVRLTVPGEFLPPSGPLLVRFVNGSEERSATVIFDTDDGLELLIPAGGFAANLARALVILWCYLALLAALGLTAGALFSFPVATFVAAALLLMALTGNYFAWMSTHGEGDHHHGPAEEPGFLQKIGAQAALAVSVAVRPALAFAPLGKLADGQWIAWRATAQALGILAGVYPGMLLVVGVLGLSRRELAAPP